VSSVIQKTARGLMVMNCWFINSWWCPRYMHLLWHVYIKPV